jgi:putative SOS response-associated peptidase YedK
MCGRYYIGISDAEIRDIVEQVEREQRNRPEQLQIKFAGDICPTDLAPVQTAPGRFEPMRWGFTAFDGKPLINARSETALAKPTFATAMRERRCLIPASGYYEWRRDGSKRVKYRFFSAETLYLAGCYRTEKDVALPSFVILTRDAVPAFAHIHERMPVIIPRERAADWLTASSAAMSDPVLDLRYALA